MSHVFKKYYDVSKYVIWGDPVEEGGKRSRMILSFRDGNPRMVVYTGGMGAESIINFPADMATLTSIMSTFKEIAQKKEPGYKEIIESLTTVYKDDKPTNEKRVLSKLYIGKSKEGIMYMSLVSENRPKLIFTFIPSLYHVFRDGDGNKIPDAVMSCRLAVAFADTMLDAIATVMIQYTNEEYTEVPRKTSLKQDQPKNLVQTGDKDILKDLESLDL